MVERVLTSRADFEQADSELTDAGFAETERSLSWRVFVNADRYWIVALDGIPSERSSAGFEWIGGKSSGQLAEGFVEQYDRVVEIPDVPLPPRKSSKRKSR